MAKYGTFLQLRVFHIVYAFSLLTVIIFVNDEINAQSVGHLRVRRNAYRDRSRLWPRAFVPYTLDKAYTVMEVFKIKTAMYQIELVSCIRFKRRKKEKAFVKILRGTGCNAETGYSGREQKVTLSKKCIFIPTIIHELMHVLGFHHEHTRPDRDYYITIKKNNIISGKHHNFNKKLHSQVTTLDLPYDYRSVMHYGHKDFSIDNSKKTIEPTFKGRTIGSDGGLSPIDIMKLNKLYRCPKRT